MFMIFSRKKIYTRRSIVDTDRPCNTEHINQSSNVRFAILMTRKLLKLLINIKIYGKLMKGNKYREKQISCLISFLFLFTVFFTGLPSASANQSLPDLYVHSVSASNECSIIWAEALYDLPTSPCEVSFYAHYSGEEDHTSKTIYFTYYASLDNQITSDDIKLSNRDEINYPDLEADTSYRHENQFSAIGRGALSPGTYYVGVLLDSEEGLVESDEANNGHVLFEVEYDKVDLVPIASQSSYQSVVNHSSSFEVELVIRNTGSSPACYDEHWESTTRKFSYQFYISTDSQISENDIPIGYDYLCTQVPVNSNNGRIWGGETLVYPHNLRIHEDILPGDYYFGVIVNIFRPISGTPERIPESNFDNNYVSLGQIKVQGIDLQPVSILAPSEIVPGDYAELTVSVTNSGGTNYIKSGQACKSLLYLSSDKILSQNDWNIVENDGTTSTFSGGELIIPSLDSGEDFTATFRIKVPNSIPDGTYWFGIKVDSESIVTEDNEENNVNFYSMTSVGSSSDETNDESESSNLNNDDSNQIDETNTDNNQETTSNQEQNSATGEDSIDTSVDNCANSAVAPCNGDNVEQDSSSFTTLFLVIIILGGLGFVMYIQRFRFNSNDKIIESKTQSALISKSRIMVQSQRTESPVPHPGNIMPPPGNMVFSPGNMVPQPRPPVNAQGVIGDDGYEWITFPPNSQAYFYKSPGSREWIKFEN